MNVKFVTQVSESCHILGNIAFIRKVMCSQIKNILFYDHFIFPQAVNKEFVLQDEERPYGASF